MQMLPALVGPSGACTPPGRRTRLLRTRVSRAPRWPGAGATVAAVQGEALFCNPVRCNAVVRGGGGHWGGSRPVSIHPDSHVPCDRSCHVHGARRGGQAVAVHDE